MDTCAATVVCRLFLQRRSDFDFAARTGTRTLRDLLRGAINGAESIHRALPISEVNNGFASHKRVPPRLVDVLHLGLERGDHVRAGCEGELATKPHSVSVGILVAGSGVGGRRFGH